MIIYCKQLLDNFNYCLISSNESRWYKLITCSLIVINKDCRHIPAKKILLLNVNLYRMLKLGFQIYFSIKYHLSCSKLINLYNIEQYKYSFILCRSFHKLINYKTAQHQHCWFNNDRKFCRIFNSLVSSEIGPFDFESPIVLPELIVWSVQSSKLVRCTKQAVESLVTEHWALEIRLSPKSEFST